MRKIFPLIILFFFIAVGAVGFWYWQRNDYSREILKLEILGPENAKAGDEVEYLVKFKNNGNVRLENVSLTFEYPDKSIPDTGTELRVVEPIKDIYPGEERIKSFKAKLLGKENDILKAKASLSYRPKNLTAYYKSETTEICQIKFVPLTLEFDLPLKAENGEAIKFSLNYFSNTQYPLKNLRVKIKYPQEFHFVRSSPNALGQAIWALPVLTRANGGKIEVEGTINGKEDEEKIFQAQLGIVKDGQFLPLKETAQSIKIVTPTLYISQLVNGHQEYTAAADELLHYEVFFKNIGSAPIQKKFLFVKLDDGFFDLSSLKSENGEFGKGDNTILWDWKSVSKLRFLGAGEEGKVEFWIKTKDGTKENIENPILNDKITLGGFQKIFGIKVNSKIELSQKIYFSQQEFWENSGPLPPKVGQATEYTIVWQIKNYWNKLKKVKVKSVLPEGVRPTGKVFPEGASFTYDSESGEIIWNIGDLAAFQGFGDNPLTLAFQITFTPNVSQQGKAPILIGPAELLGEDNWTSEILQNKVQPVDTTLPDDAGVSATQGIVQ